MADASITYRLDLVVRLLDTTTGQPAAQRQVAFLTDGRVINLQERDTGLYILLNHGRNDMRFTVQAKGYLETSVDICYADLSERYPEVEIPLIPEKKPYGWQEFVTIEGVMPGITSLAAVPLQNSSAKAASYLEKKQILKFFIAKSMEEKSYALVHMDRMEFEEFRIAKRINGLSVKLAAPLNESCRPEEPVARIVRGITEPSGKYLLRIREGTSGMEYLVRYTVDGKTVFKKISLDDPEDWRL